MAALMVVALHVHVFHVVDGVPQAGWMHFTRYGGLGVDVFFVLSGLVLYLPYARGRPLRLNEYTAARLLRIVPALWVALALSAVVTGIWSFAALRHGLFVNPWGQSGLSPDPPAWSLTVEMGFYVLLPILIWIFVAHPALRWPVLAVLFTVGIVARHAEAHGLVRTPFSYVDYFAAGIASAIIVARLGTIRQRWLVLAAASFATGLLVSGVIPHWAHRNGVAIPFAVTLAILAATKVPVPSILVWLGTISYGIYLWHWPVLEVVTDHGLYRLPDPLEPIFVAGAAIGLG